MNNKFNILKYRDEIKLTPKEKKEYYKSLKNYLTNRKYTNITPGATTIAPKLKEITNKISSKLTNLLAGTKVKEEITYLSPIPDEPVIFAHTHQGLLDNFAWIPYTPQHTIILHSIDVKKILLLMQFNTGLVLVKKNNKLSRNNAKLDVEKLLIEGHSITMFPESAYCLSPNKLHLPLNFGVIDIAKKTSAPIIPVADDYTYEFDKEKGKIIITKYISYYGKPIYVSHNDNLLEKLEEYKEQISTMKWLILEDKGVYSRKDITTSDYTDYVNYELNNLKKGGISIDKETENLWDYDNEFYDYFPINIVPIDKNGELISFNGLKKIRERNKKI